MQCCNNYYNFKNIKVIKLLLKSGTNVNMQDKYGNAALLYCCEHRDVEIVKLLLMSGASVNIQNCGGYTALMCASVLTDERDVETVKLLLDNGADVNIQDCDGYTTLMCASVLTDERDEMCSLKVLQLLLKYNANVYIKDISGQTVLNNSGTFAVKLLLEYDAEPYDTQGINIFAINIAKLNLKN